MVDTTDEWIRSRTGIERRHVAADGETTVDLAEKAARRALDAAGVAPAEVDFIAFGTTTPDLVFPNCGTLLQQRLGCRGVPAFSLETACAGFMYALSIADKYIRCGEVRRALVIGAETLSRITDWSDRSTAVLFADGAGAVVLEPSAAPGVLSTHLHSDGQYKDLLYCAGGVSRGFAARLAIIMAGNEVFKVAVTKLGAADCRAPRLLGNRPLDHPVDLLIGRIAARLAGMGRRHRLVGRALRATGRLVGRLSRAVRLISGALGRRHVALHLGQLSLQVR